MASVIPKQPKKERDQITIKLDRDVLQNLEHYCKFLDSSRDYVINQCLAFIFRKDRPFAEWLASQGITSSITVAVQRPENGATKSPAGKSKPSAVQGRLAMAE
jgi:hypothetical protein